MFKTLKCCLKKFFRLEITKFQNCKTERQFLCKRYATDYNCFYHSFIEIILSESNWSWSTLIHRRRALPANAADSCHEKKLPHFCRFSTAETVSFLALPVQRWQKLGLFLLLSLALIGLKLAENTKCQTMRWPDFFTLVNRRLKNHSSAWVKKLM